MALIRLKRGTTAGAIPTGLTHGEPAVNTTDGILYCGDTAGATVDMSGVLSFNGKTGHVLFSQIDDDLTMNVTGLSASSGITGNSTLYVGSTASFGGNITLLNNSTFGIDGDEKLTFNTARIQANTDDFQTRQKISHLGDSDTLIEFTTDKIGFEAGGVEFLSSTGTAGIIAPKGLSSAGDILVATDKSIGISPTDDRITFTSGQLAMRSNDVSVQQKLSHGGDTDTYLEFTPNNIAMQAGGVEFLNSAGTGGVNFPVGLSASGTVNIGGVSFGTDGGATFGGNITLASTYSIKNASGKDLFKSEQTSDPNMVIGDVGQVGNGVRVYVRDSHNYLGLYGGEVDIQSETVRIDNKLLHRGDNDTYLDFTPNNLNILTGGNTAFSANTTGTNIGGVSFGTGTDGGVTLGGNILLPEDGKIGVVGDADELTLNFGGGVLDMNVSYIDVKQYLRHKGDSNTYINYQADQITLTAGGTDYIDITTAGTNFADTDVVRPKLKDYSETVHAVGNVNSSTAFDFENGNVQTVTVSGIDTGSNIEWSLSNPPASGIAGTMTVIFTNGNAHGDHSFHSSIKWPGDNAPTLSSSGVDIITFMTIDAGTTYYGFVGGLNFS